MEIRLQNTSVPLLVVHVLDKTDNFVMRLFIYGLIYPFDKSYSIIYKAFQNIFSDPVEKVKDDAFISNDTLFCISSIFIKHRG